MLRQEVNFFTREDPEVGGLSQALTTLQMRAHYRLMDNVLLYGRFQYIFDQVYNLRSKSDSFEIYLPSRKYMQDELETDSRELEMLKEFYLDITLPHLYLRLGKQVVAWGESDGIRLSDIINPLDLTREGP